MMHFNVIITLQIGAVWELYGEATQVIRNFVPFESVIFKNQKLVSNFSYFPQYQPKTYFSPFHLPYFLRHQSTIYQLDLTHQSSKLPCFMEKEKERPDLP